MLISFIFFLLCFIAVGLYSVKFRQNTVDDYLLASSSIKPWMAGFSLFASENSGWMFVGYVGLAYTTGLSAIWVLLGWVFGEILILLKTARPYRAQSEKVKATTYGGLLSGWHGTDYKYLRYASAILTVLFLSTYAAAQLSAGGKALNVLIGWDLKLTAFIGFVIVLAYCWAGGIRATIWTDAVQAIVMIISLSMILGISLYHAGGFSGILGNLKAIDPGLVMLLGDDGILSFLLFATGWLFAGIGIMGQPHLMVRYMVLDDVDNAHKVVWYYAGLYSFMVILCTFTALGARVLIPELMETDPELALPSMAATYLPSVFSGMFLAGLFAAAMSTADSLVLSSSAALTKDILFNKNTTKPLWNKIGTVFIASVALGIALMENANVFQLVVFAWSAMAAGFTPILFVYCLGAKLTQPQALTMMIGGIIVSVYWEISGLTNEIYSAFPGIITGMILFGLFKIFARKA